MSNLLNTASLVVTPNSYKEGTLFSVIPNTGAGDMTVVRATTATRVNSAGLVELVPYNLFSYSEQFNDGAWTKANVTVAANTTTAPNGTVTADKVIATNTASTTRAAYQSFNPVLNSIYTISVYVKAAEYTKFAICEIGNGRFGASFDLVNQTATIIGGLSYISSLITDVGNGWFRCSVTANGSTVGWAVAFVGYPDVGASLSTSGVSYAGDGTSGVYLWGAQLVEGTLPLTYLSTTTRLNIPRLDYSLGSCPNLLLEPQRTNLALRSEEFENASWLKVGGTVTTNSLISPSGIQNADTITQSGATINFYQIVTTPTSGNYTYTVYLKKGNFDSSNLFRFGAFQTTDLGYITFNFATNTTSVVSGSIVSHSATSVGNGWYRIQYTINIPIAGAVSFYNGGVGGNIGAGAFFYSWGAQLEAGAYPTSYIPTTSATVTRNADVISKTGISSLIGQFEGTLVFNINVVQPTGLGAQILLAASNDSESQLFIISYVGNTGIIAFDFYIGGAYTFSLTSPSAVSAGLNTVGITYKTGSYKLFINGSQVATSTNSTAITNTISKLRLSSGAAPMYYNFVSVWKEALNDEQLESLTGTGFNSYAAMASFYNYTLQ